ncbi:hypothetical protein SAY87_008305 [Trapa incisa]|uniref:RRM domain-containing protein n=1 Tax=Trapa incisa TaxID=236973 RepID=A0AAN7KD14_9MYRT|nr:hypothetical protein SAY87_008305 [Trapa incisa]
MAFFGKLGNMIKQTANRQSSLGISASKPYIYQVMRCMSSSKLFIGGISYGTDEMSLREAFSKYGEVIEARVITDRETGRSRGFGFVTFTSSEEASSAIQALDGQDLHGRRVRVNYATDRQPRFGGGGYGESSGYMGGNYGSARGGYGGGNTGYGGGYGSGGGSYSNPGRGDNYGSGGGGYGVSYGGSNNFGDGGAFGSDGGNHGMASGGGSDNFSSVRDGNDGFGLGSSGGEGSNFGEPVGGGLSQVDFQVDNEDHDDTYAKRA